MKTILFILGTRPEAIKLSPVIRHFRDRLANTRVLVCSTGQHREMLDQALTFFEIEPDVKLDVMEPGQTLFGLSSKIIGGLQDVCASAHPDYIVVQGDTTTALMGAIAGYYCGARVVHVEAGLRTGDMLQPFPEEGNRVLVSRLARMHFAPTDLARDNLAREGINANVHVVGNTVIDALLWASPRASLDDGLSDVVHDASLHGRRIILVTGHRRESFGAPFEEICRAIREIAGRGDVQFMYPVHLNPNVRTPVNAILGGTDGVALFPPVSYPTMVALMGHCYLVLTDSGGIQEEAPSLGKPVLVMRNTTERPEGVSAGTSLLVGAGREAITAALTRLLDDGREYSKMAGKKNPYGDGHSSERMLKIMMENDSSLS